MDKVYIHLAVCTLCQALNASRTLVTYNSVLGLSASSVEIYKEARATALLTMLLICSLYKSPAYSNRDIC